MYSFKEQGHQHLWNGKRMTGVTTVLGVIAKPMLIGWAANMATQYAASQIKAGKEYTKDELDAIFTEAKVAHNKKRDAAADIGTLVHGAIEEYVKRGTEPQLDEQGMKMFENFRRWKNETGAYIVESEKHLYSEKLFLAGILDLVVRIGDEYWIADIKTGGVYPEAFFQMAAYHMLWEDMGLTDKITGYIILGIKKDGTFEEKRSISNEDNRAAFMAAYTIYKVTQKINKSIL